MAEYITVVELYLGTPMTFIGTDEAEAIADAKDMTITNYPRRITVFKVVPDGHGFCNQILSVQSDNWGKT